MIHLPIPSAANMFAMAAMLGVCDGLMGLPVGDDKPPSPPPSNCDIKPPSMFGVCDALCQRNRCIDVYYNTLNGMQ